MITPSAFWPNLASHARSSSSPDCDQYGEKVALITTLLPGVWNGLPFTLGHLILPSPPAAMSSLVTVSPNSILPSDIVIGTSVRVAPPE